MKVFRLDKDVRLKVGSRCHACEMEIEDGEIVVAEQQKITVSDKVGKRVLHRTILYHKSCWNGLRRAKAYFA